MCCFSRPVPYVANTRIFARRINPNRQVLVYQMQVQTEEPTAMILPLPVQQPAQEKDVRFISLKGYTSLFFDAARLFVPPQITRSSVATKGRETAPSASVPPLVVQEVGDFVASFVPTIADFRRLDPRFVIQPKIWAQIPKYADYGFAVFQLKTQQGQRAEVHPMAFSFATRFLNRLFFPTVHIHDGAVHASEMFDHQLYAQSETLPRHWQKAYYPPETYLRIPESKGVVVARTPIGLHNLRGSQPNKDILIAG
jgi:hypothetical protein